MAQNKLFKALQAKAKRLEQTFRSRGWEKVGKEVSNYIVPDRGRFLTGDNPTESNYGRLEDRQYVLDDTPEQALNFLVSGFMSMLTPETSPWLKLVSPNPSLMELKNVRVWLDDVSQLILTVFSQSDVYGTLHNTFTEFGAFSTGCQLLDSDPINTLQPKSYTYGEYFLLNGRDGYPDTFLHKSWWSPEELRNEFGEENLSDDVKQDLDNKAGVAEKRYMVWHLIEPDDGRTPGLSNPAKLPFTSVFWQKAPKNTNGKMKLLRVGGYHEFPVQAPRWAVISNDTYGKEAPGFKQLQNSKMLQSIVEDRLVATNLVGRPPLVSNGHEDEINPLPGGITYGVDAAGSQFSVGPLMPTYRPDLNALIASEDRTRELIDIGFFRPLFLIVSDTSDAKRMTATEVVSRNEEKFAMLGPILNRVFNELLKPMIDRTFNILARQGFFEEDGPYPAPEELQGSDLDVEFVSVLAQAQKAVGLNNIDRFVERLGLLAQLDPSALDKFDTDAAVEQYGLNVPARLLREDEETEQIREQRAEQEAAMAQAAAMESAAATAKDLGSADASEGTALAALAEEEA